MIHDRKTSMNLEVKKLTLVAALAAVYAVVSYILPGFPMIGVPGSSISIARSLEMGYGFILGPVLGPIAALLGDLTSKMILRPTMIPFAFLAPISAFVAAATSRRRVFGVQGWVPAVAISAILILGWYATPIGREAPFYPGLHIIGLGILFSGSILARYINSIDKKKVTIGVALASFSSTMAGHMAGNLLSMAMFPGVYNAISFMTILPISAVERLVITLISTVIGVPLIFTIRAVFPDLIKEKT
jgi:hypothetical protein